MWCLYQHRSAGFAKVISKVCRVIRYEGKWEKTGKVVFIIPRNKKRQHYFLMQHK